jgi:hypothetical protein
VVCAGSATQYGLWSYTEYRIEGTRCQVQRRVFDLTKRSFRDADSFEIVLHGEGKA